MAVTIMCPNLRCRKVLAVPESVRGRRVRCTYCKTLFMVPMTKGPRSKLSDQELGGIMADTGDKGKG